MLFDADKCFQPSVEQIEGLHLMATKKPKTLGGRLFDCGFAQSMAIKLLKDYRCA